MRQRGELTWSCVVRRRALERDRAFLEQAHLAALGPVALVGYGWTKQRLQSQFLEEVRLKNCEVIVVDGSDAGYISTEDRRTHWYVDAFAIVPNYQRRGIGAAALRGLLADAGARPVRLSVLRTNPARSLYTRLGFRVIGGDRLREFMEWNARAA